MDWKGILKGIGYFVVYMALALILNVLLNTALGALVPGGVDNIMLGSSFLTAVLSTLIFYLIFRKDLKPELRLGEIDLKELVLPLVVAFSYSMVFNLMTHETEPENLMDYSIDYFNAIFPMLGTILITLNSIVLAPFSEEMVFRGMIFRTIEKSNGLVVALIVSSVLFGIAHFSSGVLLVVGAVVMGAVFGYIYYKYGSLWISIFAHMLANTADNVVDFMYSHNVSNMMITVLEIAFAIIFCVGLYMIYKKDRVTAAQ